MSVHATTPTALGTFFAYPQDAAGTVEDYWRDAGGTSVRMTGACKRAFLATIEALIERAVVPANFGSVPASEGALAGATYLTSSAPFSLVDLGPWSTGAGRDAIGALLSRGCPYRVWERMVSLVAGLFRTTGADIGSGQWVARVLMWQGALLDFTTSGFVTDDDSAWYNFFSRDWAGAAADQSAQDTGASFNHPWGPYVGGVSSDVVEAAVGELFSGLMADISVGGGSGNLLFMEDALNLSYDVIRTDGVSPGNWFSTSAASLVGAVTLRRTSNAWGVLQAMLAQMRFTHLVFPFEIVWSHTEETREVQRVVGWDPVDMDWTCSETSDATTTTTTYYTNQVIGKRGYGPAGGVAPSVELDFSVDNSDPDAMSVLARTAPPSNVGPDGPYSVVGRTILQHCVLVNSSAETWTKTASRLFQTDVDSAQPKIPAYPATALVDYVDAYGHVHFADKLAYSNSTTEVSWVKYCMRQEDGNADLSVPVGNHADWLAGQVPGVTLPPISPFSQALFDAAVAEFWDNVIAVYPTTPNATIDGVQMYYPTGFYGYSGQLQHIALDPSDNYRKGRLSFGFSDVESVFPREGAEVYAYEATVAGSAIAGYKWKFKAMPTD